MSGQNSVVAVCFRRAIIAVSTDYATAAIGIGFGLSGWLLWRRSQRRLIAAALLFSAAFGSLGLALGEIVAGTETLTHALVIELRAGIPSLLGGWLCWRGRPARQIVAAMAVSLAVSFTLQAVAYSKDTLTMLVLALRAGVPGLICGWLLWRGHPLHRIASVLLFTWPLSYLVYALSSSERAFTRPAGG